MRVCSSESKNVHKSFITNFIPTGFIPDKINFHFADNHKVPIYTEHLPNVESNEVLSVAEEEAKKISGQI